MFSPAIIRELGSVDWNFPKPSKELFRTPHWYPGTFPPELPSTLIQATTQPGDTVFDPYGGVGTTSTEALRLNRKAWCVELNRVAALTAYVSGAVLLLRMRHEESIKYLLSSFARGVADSEESSLFSETLCPQDSRDLDACVGELVRPGPRDFLDQLMFAREPNFDRLDAWYHENTLKQISRFMSNIERQECAILQLLGIMALSANMKTLSSQTRSWGHIADNVRPKVLVEKDLTVSLRRWFARFSNSLQNVILLPAFSASADDAPFLQVSLHDWSEKSTVAAGPMGSVKALITSPPYGGAIDYILSQRLSYYLLGASEAELLAAQRVEVGARRRRFADKSRGVWAERLCQCIVKQIDHLDHNGTLMLVMPHKSEGRSNGNEVVDDALKTKSWLKQFSIDRSIRSQRARQAWTSIKRETITFYRREDSIGSKGA